jgi:hypothetical protein
LKLDELNAKTRPCFKLEELKNKQITNKQTTSLMPRAIVAVAAHQLYGFAQHTQFVFDGVRYLGLEVAKPRTLRQQPACGVVALWSANNGA